jgi:hypothetical protein
VAQKVQHGLPSLVLLGDGLMRIGDGLEFLNLALASAEIVTSVLVMASIARAWRRARMPAAAHHASHAVDWVDIFLGGMLFVEALVHQRETGHLPRPTVLLGVVMLVVGVLHRRLASAVSRRRSLSVTSTGMTVPRRFLRRFEASWRNIVTFDLPDSALAGATSSTGSIRVVTRNGRMMNINVADIANPTEVLPVVVEARARYQASRLAGRTEESRTDADNDPTAHGHSVRGQHAETD